MGKTYSKKQMWIEMHAKQGKKVSRHRTPGLFSLGYQPAIAEVEEKLCRHPNKKSSKCHMRREYFGGTYLNLFPNPCGDAYERSSRLRLIKSTMKKTRRAKLKMYTINEINNSFE